MTLKEVTSSRRSSRARLQVRESGVISVFFKFLLLTHLVLRKLSSLHFSDIFLKMGR